MFNILSGLGALVNPASTLATTLIGQIFGDQEEQEAPATFERGAPQPQYVAAPQPPEPVPSALDFYFSGATPQYSDGGPVAAPKALQIMQAMGIPSGAPSGMGYSLSAPNPAYQPLADGLNFWLGGGLTGPDAPGWDNLPKGTGYMPKGRGYAEGGEVAQEIPDEDLIQEAMQAVSGTYQGDANGVIAQFVERFGDQALADLASRARAQQPQHPINTASDGKSDSIPAVINGVQPARLSEGEYIVPADVVSGIGKGSTDAGVRRLQEMADKVRAVTAAKDKK